ncbi:hypothetical protein ACFS27_22895 [Promicromonospora vindobonensis]|uniref:Uncharacterized protein n=1 Tax=Promicromonospora vindobonensis TaxID=195748 RepID=A0ABW5VY43_9MICO
MTGTATHKADLAIASADSPARRDFTWQSTDSDRKALSIVRTAQSSPVWIQANN